MKHVSNCQLCGAAIVMYDGIRAVCDTCRAKRHDGKIVMSGAWRWNEAEGCYEETFDLVPPPPPAPDDGPSRYNKGRP